MMTAVMDDAAILLPDREVVLSDGQQVTVREFRFREAVELGPAGRPIVEALVALGHDPGMVDADVIQRLVREHWDSFAVLTAAACNRGTDWFEGLRFRDGLTLVTALWSVNSDFFVLPVVMKAASALDGAGSSPT